MRGTHPLQVSGLKVDPLPASLAQNTGHRKPRAKTNARSCRASAGNAGSPEEALARLLELTRIAFQIDRKD